ncbi:hypothetical protein niasHT_036365 [Heterodera trifolii]
MADGNEWKRESMLHFAQIVRLDLMKASLIALHCAYISNEDDEFDIDTNFKDIQVSLQETAAHVADWVEKMLEITWPTISRTRAITAIGDSDIKQTKEAYQSVANKIKQELVQLGEAKYDYAVIVFPNWTDPEEMEIICEANSCLKLINIKQINVIVVRIEANKELACKAAEWFTPTMESKMKEVINVWQDDKKPLSELAKELKQMLKFYRNLVLIHNWKYFSSKATITLGVAPTLIVSASAEQGFKHKIDLTFADAAIFHVHMLL